ncbi:MAG: hypothetical protein KF901_27400 [Myxococcales bacterium]|nr:hypothetical protein [Myxococcales bacterium]
MKRALLSLALLASCGDDGALPFVMQIVADDGSVAGAAIALDAVDAVQIVVSPQAADGGFAPMDPRSFEGGDVEARVSAVGEWVLTLRRGWIERNATMGAGSFRLHVPLQAEASSDGHTRDPSLRVLFYQGTESIAESSPRLLAWPLAAGGETSVTVVCRPGFTDRCASR